MDHRKLTFEDLAPIRIIVEVEHGGEILEIPLKTLTYAEWNKLGTDIPTPTPPISGVDKQGRPIFNNSDPTYITQVEQVAEQRVYARLLASLDMEVPGNTQQEKLDALRNKVDVNVMRQLVETISSFALKGEARVKHRAETFQSERAGEAESVLPVGVDV